MHFTCYGEIYRSERGVARSFDASLNSFGPVRFGPL